PRGRRRRRHGRRPPGRDGRGTRRRGRGPGRALQGIPGYGLARGDEGARLFQGSLFPGRRRGRGQARPRGHRGARAVQGTGRDRAQPTGRRPAAGNGLLRSADDRGHEAGAVRSHHGRGPTGEPPARRHDHEGRAELPSRVTAAEIIPFPAPDEGPEERPVLVLDLGGQYAQLIARRVRECRVYSELVGHGISAAEARARKPAALILSGGPASVYADAAPRIDEELYELDVPVLGICYGAQLMALDLGGTVERTGVSEFGKTALHPSGGELFNGLPEEQTAWMSHRDTVTAPPEGAAVTGESPATPVAAFEALERGLYGVQFHPEVVHTPHGQDVLKNFLYRVAGLAPTWTAAAV